MTLCIPLRAPASTFGPCLPYKLCSKRHLMRRVCARVCTRACCVSAFAWYGHATVALPVFKLLRKLDTYAQTDAPKRRTTLNRCLSIPPKAKAHETMLQTICTSYVNILVLNTRANPPASLALAGALV
jgi:hypothetical protein